MAIWPFSFFQFIPKWDNLDCYLPYKYFVSDNLWNGHAPWWNFYMKLGYPAYADMQNGMWNPIVWVLMLFGKYTTVSLVTEIVIYFLIGALGIYRFSGLFIKSQQIDYNSFVVEVNNPVKEKSLVALSQSYHHFWKATINGKPAKIYKINDGIMGVETPPYYAGEIKFSFSPFLILKLSFFVSLIGYLGVLLMIFKLSQKR